MKMRNEARQVVSQSIFIYSLWFHLANMATINRLRVPWPWWQYQQCFLNAIYTNNFDTSLKHLQSCQTMKEGYTRSQRKMQDDLVL